MALYTRIVVPLDGSKRAEKALDQAMAMAKLTGASLHLVRVVDFSSRDRFGDLGMLYEYEAMAKALEEERTAAETYLANLGKRLEGEGLTVTTDVIDGIASKAIVRFTEPGDLIVMATHGRTGMKRWFVGSVAEDILRHSTVPVLLVRATKDESGNTV